MTRAGHARSAIGAIAIVAAALGGAVYAAGTRLPGSFAPEARGELAGAVRGSLPAVTAVTPAPDRVASAPSTTRPAIGAAALLVAAAGLLLTVAWSGALLRTQSADRPWRRPGSRERAPPAVLLT